MKRRWLIIAGVILVVLIILGSRDSMPSGTTYSTRPDGAQAIFELLEQKGLKPERSTKPFTRLDNNATGETLFIIAPEDLAGVHELGEWVKKGNRVVYFLERAIKENTLTEELSLSWKETTAYEQLASMQVRESEFRCPSDNHDDRCSKIRSITDGSLRNFEISDGWEAVRGASSEPTAVMKKLELGEVWVFADPLLINNEYIDKADNLRLIFQLASSSSKVSFDEFHHGYISDGESGAAERLGLVVAFGSYLAIFLIIFALSRGLRFGPPVPQPALQSAAGTDFVTALGLLYADNNATKVLHRYIQQWKERIEKVMRIRPQRDLKATFGEMEKRGALAADQGTALLNGITNAINSDELDRDESDKLISNLEGFFRAKKGN